MILWIEVTVFSSIKGRLGLDGILSAPRLQSWVPVTPAVWLPWPWGLNIPPENSTCVDSSIVHLNWLRSRSLQNRLVAIIKVFKVLTGDKENHVSKFKLSSISVGMLSASLVYKISCFFPGAPPASPLQVLRRGCEAPLMDRVPLHCTASPISIWLHTYFISAVGLYDLLSKPLEYKDYFIYVFMTPNS